MPACPTKLHKSQGQAIFISGKICSCYCCVCVFVFVFISGTRCSCYCCVCLSLCAKLVQVQVPGGRGTLSQVGFTLPWKLINKLLITLLMKRLPFGSIGSTIAQIWEHLVKLWWHWQKATLLIDINVNCIVDQLKWTNLVNLVNLVNIWFKFWSHPNRDNQVRSLFVFLRNQHLANWRNAKVHQNLLFFCWSNPTDGGKIII